MKSTFRRPLPAQSFGPRSSAIRTPTQLVPGETSEASGVAAARGDARNGAPAAAAEVRRTLGLEDRGRSRLKRIVALVALAALAGGGGYAWYRLSRPSPVSYTSARAAVGELTVTVSATGTLEPRGRVEVGPQISGRIASVHADFNDQVKVGQVLVELDRSQLRARVNEARARLVAARAAQRDARVAAAEASQNLARTQTLVNEGLTPAQQLDTTTAARDRSLAGIDSAKAQVALAEAALSSAETDLEWATIRAPISGVILTRAAEPGQVVAASFQPPVLFVIAEDLRTMELSVDIDEADVGRVKAGQSASFSVDAYPGRSFDAKVESVRNSPRTVQNVVTYEAILSVTNHDEILKPGMTANVTITTDRESRALLVPNAALRFTPPSIQEKPEERREQRVFVEENGVVRRIALSTGQSDGQRTIVLDGGVKPGTEVLTDVATPGRPER